MVVAIGEECETANLRPGSVYGTQHGMEIDLAEAALLATLRLLGGAPFGRGRSLITDKSTEVLKEGITSGQSLGVPRL